jgi:hypothetical protein
MKHLARNDKKWTQVDFALWKAIMTALQPGKRWRERNTETDSTVQKGLYAQDT